MVLLNKTLTHPVKRPLKVLQFGEGGFLRAFVDYMIDVANEKGNFNGDIVIVKPIPMGNLDHFKEQDCQYTLSMTGMENGEAKTVTRVITSVADAVDAYVLRKRTGAAVRGFQHYGSGHRIQSGRRAGNDAAGFVPRQADEIFV